MHGQTAGHGGVDLFEESQDIGAGVALVRAREDFAANRAIVPLRLWTWVIVLARAGGIR